MGNLFSGGGTPRIEIAVRNGAKTALFTDVRLEGSPDNTQLANLMLSLHSRGDPAEAAEVVYFKLSQDNKHPYMPSEEKLISLMDMIESYRTSTKKGWTSKDDESAPPEIHIKMLMLDVWPDEKKKELTAKMMMFHIAVVMSKFNMVCDDVCLMGGMCEFKEMFSRLNDMVCLLKSSL